MFSSESVPEPSPGSQPAPRTKTTREKLHTLSDHREEIADVQFSPDGRLLVSTDFYSTDKIDLKAWGVNGHTKEVVDVAFSPDGTRLATASFDGSVRIWDITPDGASEWFTLAAHSDFVHRFGLTADGKYLATASSDGIARVWEAASGEELRVYTSPGGPLFEVAFTPDGKNEAAPIPVPPKNR